MLQYSSLQSNYDIRETETHLIVPVVMMKEGVHNGSGGPILHKAEYYTDNFEQWNGIPLTAMHPVNPEGNPISVNDSNQDQWVIGEIHDTYVEEGKLKAKAWIDKQRAIAVNAEVLTYIQEKKKLDVSIGAFTENRSEAGVHNEEEYEAVTLSYKPDHLALLPGSKGACSWNDGCGVRVNEAQKMDIPKDFLQQLKLNLKEELTMADEKDCECEQVEDYEVTREDALDVLSEDFNDTEKLLAMASDEVSAKVKKGLEFYEEKRKELVEAIQDNTEEFTEEELGNFEMSMLDKIKKSTTPTDYSANGPTPEVNADTSDEEVLLPAGVEFNDN